MLHETIAPYIPDSLATLVPKENTETHASYDVKVATFLPEQVFSRGEVAKHTLTITQDESGKTFTVALEGSESVTMEEAPRGLLWPILDSILSKNYDDLPRDPFSSFDGEGRRANVTEHHSHYDLLWGLKYMGGICHSLLAVLQQGEVKDVASERDRATFEGVVLRDHGNLRRGRKLIVVIERDTEHLFHLELHSLKGNVLKQVGPLSVHHIEEALVALMAGGDDLEYNSFILEGAQLAQQMYGNVIGYDDSFEASRLRISVDQGKPVIVMFDAFLFGDDPESVFFELEKKAEGIYSVKGYSAYLPEFPVSYETEYMNMMGSPVVKILEEAEGRKAEGLFES